MDELGAELDGEVQAGVVHGVDPSTDPVAGLEHYDAPAGRPQPLGGGEPRNARSQDDDVGAGIQRRGYSYRSATIGSSRAARRAGQMPKKSPTSALKPNATTTAAGEISVFHCITRASTIVAPMPEQDADHAAEDAQGQRLDQELQQDVAAGWRRAPCGRRSRGCARSPRPA